MSQQEEDFATMFEASNLGKTPPEPLRLHWEAAKVGFKATWTAGLVAGVLVLIANNPRKGNPARSPPHGCAGAVPRWSRGSRRAVPEHVHLQALPPC